MLTIRQTLNLAYAQVARLSAQNYYVARGQTTHTSFSHVSGASS